MYQENGIINKYKKGRERPIFFLNDTHLARAPGPVSVGVGEVVPRVRVAVVVVDVGGGQRIIVPD